MGVMDEVCITFFESIVVALSLALFCRPLVHGVNISERPRSCFSNISFLGPTHFTSEVGSTKYSPNFVWRLRFGCLILRSGPPCVDVILKIPAVNKLSISSFSIMHSSIV